MFATEAFGVTVGVPHLALAAVFLAVATTWGLDRATRLSRASLLTISILTTQALVAALLMLLLSFTDTPVHDAGSWINYYLARFNCIVVWLLAPIVTAPAAVITAAWSNKAPDAE